MGYTRAGNMVLTPIISEFRKLRQEGNLASPDCTVRLYLKRTEELGRWKKKRG